VRGLVTAIVGLSLTACSQSAGYDKVIEDDRFDLLSVTMPPLLKKDAQKCVRTMNLVRGTQEADDKLVARLLDFWQAVDEKFLTVEDAKSVLPSGGDPAIVESILPGGVSLPTAVAHDCGVYSGAVSVEIGLLSLSDSVAMAVEHDPEIFKSMGTSLDQIKSGLVIIKAQAEGVRGLALEDLVSCTAIYKSASVSDVSIEPFSNIWMSAFVDEIESGRLDAAKIREQSSYWAKLAEGGPDGLVAMDAYKSKAAECDEWINEAVAKQAAE